MLTSDSRFQRVAKTVSKSIAKITVADPSVCHWTFFLKECRTKNPICHDGNSGDDTKNETASFDYEFIRVHLNQIVLKHNSVMEYARALVTLSDRVIRGPYAIPVPNRIDDGGVIDLQRKAFAKIRITEEVDSSLDFLQQNILFGIVYSFNSQYYGPHSLPVFVKPWNDFGYKHPHPRTITTASRVFKLMHYSCVYDEKTLQFKIDND